jgi:hypothetical protein
LRRDATLALLSVAAVWLAFLATRIPLRTHYLLNWDAVQFALGLQHFDVVHHEPHPPGYPGYILAGRLLLPLAGDPNQALIAISIAGECLGAALLFLFARSLFGISAAWVAGAGLAISPLYWYYGEAANVYALEPFLVLAVAWPCWRIWSGDRRFVMPAALVLGLSGAIRPSSAVFLFPLFAACLLKLRSVRLAVGAAAVTTVVTLGWLLPVVRSAGGLPAYITASLQLADSVSASTAIWKAGLSGLMLSGNAVLLGLVWELGAFAVILGFGLLVAPQLGQKLDLPPGWLGFTLLWALPPLPSFLFVHIGQVAYVQVFAPALFLVLGPALRATAGALGRPHLAPALVGVALLANLATFFLPPSDALGGRLRIHDAQTERTVEIVESFDPATTVLITDAEGSGSYRSAQYYLPAYHRVAVGRDRRGHIGEIFGDVYEPGRFARSVPPEFPSGTETFVFLDRSTVTDFVVDPALLQDQRLPGGGHIYVWQGRAPEVRCGALWLEPPRLPCGRPSYL